jgi:hypothetical protein
MNAPSMMLLSGGVERSREAARQPLALRDSQPAASVYERVRRHGHRALTHGPRRAGGVLLRPVPF